MAKRFEHDISTEPNTGLETLKLRTRAVKKGDTYEISGEKMFVFFQLLIVLLRR
jgi:hypothetical protein